MTQDKFFEFIKQLSFNVYQHKGDSSFKIEDLIDFEPVHSQQHISKIHELIKSGFFFLEFADEEGKYKKTYRIPEICRRTVDELEKDNIHKDVLKLITEQPTILHIEFERWLRTKHSTMLSYVLDKYWHNFMIYSYEYNSWCYDKFGYLIHHIPTPDYEKAESNAVDIIADHVEYFREYRKKYPITKTITLYNFCHKLALEEIPFETIKKIIFELINKTTDERIIKSTLSENLITNYVEAIEKGLDEFGYFVIADKLELNDYYHICNKLGVIINTTNIEVNENSNRLFNKSDAMPFHTDAHDVDIVSWYCQTQDDVDGQSILIDMKDIEYFFDKNEIELLGNVMIKYPIYKRFYVGIHPLYKNKKLYYAPWLKVDYSNKESELIQKFDKIIEEKDKIYCPLKKGQSLFVNNLRVLHGRNEIQSNSKRLLYRTHIMR